VTAVRLMVHRRLSAEPGFARREPEYGVTVASEKERVRGGTMGSPTQKDARHVGSASEGAVTS
jgi:hypothetical protein